MRLPRSKCDECIGRKASTLLDDAIARVRGGLRMRLREVQRFWSGGGCHELEFRFRRLLLVLVTRRHGNLVQ